MKRLLITAAVIAALGGLAACETATPYGPAPRSPQGTMTGFGYSDYRIDSNHWRVTFSGNSMTSRETVEKYLLYRAAELTRDQGYDWFVPAERHTERNTSYFGTTDPFYSSPYWGAYGWGWRPYWRYSGPWGWRAWDPWGGGPFWGSTVDIQQVNRYEASAEIEMGRGPPPPGVRVFDAHEVIANIGPSIVRPQDHR